MSDQPRPALVNMEALATWHRRNRVGNCASDREAWPCSRWRDAETMNALHADLLDARSEIERLGRELAEATSAIQVGYRRRLEIESERDRALMTLASCQEERSAFRQQRDEAQQALATLMGATP